jgi:hypothetical protein
MFTYPRSFPDWMYGQNLAFAMDAAQNVQLTNGLVSQWGDIGPYAGLFTQATNANAPGYATDANGFPYLSFLAATVQYLNGNSVINSLTNAISNLTIFAVSSFANVSSASGMLIDICQGPNTQGRCLVYGTQGTGLVGVAENTDAGSGDLAYIYPNPQDTSSGVKARAVLMDYVNDDYYWNCNGVENTGSLGVTGGKTPATNSDGTRIGYGVSGYYPLTGKIYFLAGIYNMTLQQRQTAISLAKNYYRV